MISTHIQCGDCALSTLLETRLKQAICKINVKSYTTETQQSQSVKYGTKHSFSHIETLSGTFQQTLTYFDIPFIAATAS